MNPNATFLDWYIVDLDGTTFDVSWRDPYDTSQCGLDPPVSDVVYIIRVLQETHFIAAVSGRQEKARRQSEAALAFCGIRADALFMRPTRDQRPDHEVKEAIYHRHLSSLKIRGVFDDRQTVVDMWRRLGLTVFQVDKRF